MKISRSLEDYEVAYVTEQLHERGFKNTDGLSYKELVYELAMVKNREGKRVD